MASNSKRESLPFEPKSKKRSQDPDASTNTPVKSTASTSPLKTSAVGSDKQETAVSSQQDSLGIPEVVSRRMMRRMAIFAGVPTFLGMSSFVVSYILLTRHIAEFPNALVLIVSLAFFGLGTVGLSYGVLSASWQEDTVGSLLGTEEFAVNFRRLVQGFRKSKGASAPE
ncbi:MAG: PAM68 family protein [Cyanobacteria bacterium P01_D01_bin.156]